jgi:putative endonuclease
VASTFQKGRAGEALARQTLVDAGFQIIAANYRCPHGELDLVAERADLLCFVEVRTRASSELGLPEETIDARKRARVHRAAEHWLTTTGTPPRAMRFDVIAIVTGEEPPRITWIQGAFEVDS